MQCSVTGAAVILGRHWWQCIQHHSYLLKVSRTHPALGCSIAVQLAAELGHILGLFLHLCHAAPQDRRLRPVDTRDETCLQLNIDRPRAPPHIL